MRGQQLQFNDNPAFDKAKGSEGVLVSIPFKEELERTTDVGTFSPGVQEQRPQTFPLRIIGNTQVHPETVDPVHSWLIYQVKTNNHSNKRNPLTFTGQTF